MSEEITRRAYLALAAALGNVPTGEIDEAVRKVGMVYPDWDMDEKKPLSEWIEELS